MYTPSRFLIPATLAACAYGTAVFAQTVPTPTANPCSANPDKPQGDKSLSGRLDDCNGALVPPKVGDGEIVQPAPDGGTMRVVPPGGLPDQQRDGTRTEGMPAQKPAGYGMTEIVEAIKNSASAARVLASFEPTRVDVRDISIMLGGSNVAVLNSSLSEHAADLDALRASVQQNPALAAAVGEKGLAVIGIVGAKIGDDQSVTLFGR